MKIGLLSDTHSFCDKKVYSYFNDVDEIWHAGDIGDIKVLDDLMEFKKTRAVYGNIDNFDIRNICKQELIFSIHNFKIYIIVMHHARETILRVVLILGFTRNHK